jgi:O-antigen/teichoic acid export membrane protein
VNRPSPARVVLNVLSTWGGQAISLGLSFLFTPFIVHSLGDSAYGVWLLTLSVVGFMGLLDLGVRGAVTRYVARFAAVGDDASASRVASSALRIFVAITAVVALVSVVMGAFAARLFSIPEAHQEAARIVLVIAGLNLGVTLVGGTYAGGLAACSRIELLNLVDVTTAIVRTLATVAALSAGHGLVAMALVQLAVSTLRVACVAGLLRRVYPALRVAPRLGDAAHVRLIFGFSLFSFLIHVSGRFIYYADALVIGAFLPVASVTAFGIGSSLVEYARMLISSVSYATSPVASSLEGAGDHRRIQSLLLTTTGVSMMILLPIALTFVLRGETFIRLWMGPAYAGPSGGVLAILALPLMLHGAAHGTGGIMLAIGRHKPMVPAMLVEAAANLAISIALVRTMGIAGVAWGTAVPSLVAGVAFWPVYVHRATGVPLRRFLAAAWLRPALAVAPFAVATYAIERFWPAATLAAFFVQVAACTVLAIAAGWWLCVPAEARAAAAASVRRVFGSGSAAAVAAAAGAQGRPR